LTSRALPRGPHSLSREDVAASQRERLFDACTDLLAEGGYAAVTIGELARRAGVSRGAFYEHFSGKEDCVLAAYDRFAARLVAAMTADLDLDADWHVFIDRLLDGYLSSLEDDPVAARAFVVELDAAGPAARARRREAIHAFATLIATRHAAIRERDPSLGPLPQRAYLGLALGVREMVREQLETDPEPRLSDLAPDVRTWINAMIAGA
jgi:AcrR family transcriptional regulator